MGCVASWGHCPRFDFCEAEDFHFAWVQTHKSRWLCELFTESALVQRRWFLANGLNGHVRAHGHGICHDT